MDRVGFIIHASREYTRGGSAGATASRNQPCPGPARAVELMTEQPSPPPTLDPTPLPAAPITPDDRHAKAVYKQDRRSKVWLHAPAGDPVTALVVKRFEYAPWRQWLAGVLGVHPAQRERRANRRLLAAGLPVAPIVAQGRLPCRFGVRHWLATPPRGRSLQRLLRDPAPAPHARRRAAVHAVARLTAQLMRAGVFFKDLKTSNILIDECDRVWLIDVGSARRMWTRRSAIRMLVMLDKTAAGDGASKADRVRGLRVICRESARAWDHRTVSRVIGRRLLQ